MLSPHNVPDGCGSIQAELYYSDKYRPLDRPIEDLIQPTIDDLTRCGLLRPDDRILVQAGDAVAVRERDLRSRSPGGDSRRCTAISTKIGVLVCGRYGEWGYHWTDESFISGEQAAQRALDRVTSRGVPA